MKKILFIISFILFLLPNINKAEEKPGSAIASLQGSKASLLKQNYVIRTEGLTRIKDDKQLEEYIEKGILVPIDRLENVNIDYRLKQKYCYALPCVADFLADFGAAYFRNFGLYIMINSAVRPIAYQKEIQKTNSNAASPTGPYGSPHPTAAAVDVAYTDMNEVQVEWATRYLKYFERKSLIEATMEHTQTVFHIMVFKTYKSSKK